MSAIKNRKVLIKAFGDISQLDIITEDLPPPPKNNVQVKITYSGFSGADVNMRMGLYPMQKPAPLSPGYCFVGTVSVNGPGSKKFNVGDKVVALTVYDSEAEYINIPEKYLVPVPEGLPLQQAVALVLDWTTAYGMVYRVAKVSRGQRVFVHGVSGAVGQALMILCQLEGATVYGTASPKNHAALEAQGVHPFDYRNKDWIATMKNLGGVHAAFDPLGFESFDESYAILTTKEKSVMVGYGNNLRSLNKYDKPPSVFGPLVKLFARGMYFWSNKGTNFYYITRDQKTFAPELRTLLGMVKDQRIVVPIKAVFQFDDIKAAHENWTTGHGMGSVLIQVAPEE